MVGPLEVTEVLANGDATLKELFALLLIVLANNEVFGRVAGCVEFNVNGLLPSPVCC